MSSRPAELPDAAAERTMDRLIAVHRIAEDLSLQSHALCDVRMYEHAARMRGLAALFAATEARLRDRLVDLLGVPPEEVWDAVHAWGR